MMGFLGVAAGVISTICSGIGGAVMRAVGAFAENLVVVPVPHIVIAKLIGVVIGIISAVSEALTEKPHEETPEEIGLKAEVAEKKPEDFDSINEYINYLREEIKIDEERLREMKAEDKVAYAAVGAGLYVKQVEEKYGMELPPEFWRSTASLKEDGQIPEEMPENLIVFMKEHGIKSGAVFSDYLSNKLKAGSVEQDAMFDALKDVYRKEYPEATDGELNAKVNMLNHEINTP